jgi:hypothetical protein
LEDTDTSGGLAVVLITAQEQRREIRGSRDKHYLMAPEKTIDSYYECNECSISNFHATSRFFSSPGAVKHTQTLSLFFFFFFFFSNMSDLKKSCKRKKTTLLRETLF